MTDAPAPEPEEIEGDFTELPEQTRALVATQDEQPSGTLAIALMPKEQFEARLVALQGGVQRIAQIKRALFTKDTDYGVIPGTKVDTLLKPGAEKLADFYNLRAAFEHKRTAGDGTSAPHIHYLSTCYLHLGATDGPIIAEGSGSASSWEKKYRYRKGGHVCPTCGQQAIMRSKFPDRQTHELGWYCNKKAGGCGTNFGRADAFPDVDPPDVENPDPYELDNTLLKMAEKRAFIDAVLRGTNSSGLFTQDVEDQIRADDGGGERAASPRQPATTRPLASRPASAPEAASESASGAQTFEGPVVAAMERVTERAAPDWYPAPASARLGQGSIGFKVGNSKHNAMLVGDMAFVAHDAAIGVGERIRVTGVLELVEWDKDKPKKKEVRHIRSIEVDREGWRNVYGAQGEPLDDATLPLSDDSASAIPPPDDAEPSGSPPDGMPPPITAADLLAEPWDDTPADDGLTVEADLIWLDAKWANAGAAQVAIVTLFGTSDLDIGKVRGIMEQDWAMQQLVEGGMPDTSYGPDTGGWLYKPGDIVQVLGAWSHTGKGVKFIALTDVRRAK